MRTHALDGVKVDLGLARARNAVNEDDVSPLVPHGARDGIKGGALAVRETLGARGRSAGERGALIAGPSDAPAMLNGNNAALEQG